MEIPSLDSIKGVINQGADLLARGASVLTQGATASAAKVEGAARVGKLRLDLLALERKFNRHCTGLGQLTYDHYAEGRPIAELLDERDFAYHLGYLRELKAAMAAAEARIKQAEAEGAAEGAEPEEEPDVGEPAEKAARENESEGR